MSSGDSGTRQKILDAARRLFEERGVHDVGLGEVGRAAGVSRQAVYLHFGSRAGLLVALVDHIDRSQSLGEMARSVWEAPGSLEALDAFVKLQADYTPRIYQIASSLDAARQSDEAAAAAWEDRMEGRRAACRRLIRWLQEDGLLAAGWGIEEAADLLWELTSIRTWADLVVDRGWSAGQYELRLRRLLKRTFVDQ